MTAKGNKTSRMQAIEQGLPRYFTGIPCKHGHVTERFVVNWKCVGCDLVSREKKRVKLLKVKLFKELTLQKELENFCLENSLTLISRKQAFETGSKYYFTGKKCKYGHIAKRLVTTRYCIDCHRLDAQSRREKKRNKKIKLNEQNFKKLKISMEKYCFENGLKILTLEEAKKQNLIRYFSGVKCAQGHLAERYTRSNSCCECEKLKTRKMARKYREKRSEYMLNWRKLNQDKTRNGWKNWYKNNAENVKRYRQLNSEKYLYYRWVRIARILQATLKEVNPDEIKAIYAERKKISEQTGIIHHVDHIVPLRGKNVCGLHVPWNMQIIPGVMNQSKGTKFDEWS